ncbi:hypothetical protein OCL06_10335 [Alteromonas sp. ASW11-19]|uniref:HAD family hydrolase n=1 Tax=Alteromonas salexigens TaxID=2982530 RepID=A0ABT2VRG3_9ALTE|nr:hypothetical protein [Alteromonas salexigens]MCU7554998.1 hypothetical protein [Alteromonas salexigens]
MKDVSHERAGSLTPLCQQVLNTVAQHNIKTVSFDIFDTIVFRNHGHPQDIFVTACESVKQERFLALEPAEYSELRASVEQRVKRQVDSAEVTLDDIISALPFDVELRQTLLEAELRAESTHGYINPAMPALIESLLANGVQVILISDMYLTGKQICRLYFNNYAVLRDLPLYVSGEQQCNKASGELFKLVQQQHALEPDSWLHVGDHPVSDYEVPLKQGLHCVWLNSELPQVDILRQERALFGQKQGYNASRLISAAHFKGAHGTAAFALGTFVWGPVLYAFADWIIDQSRAAGSRCILCLMREAEVFAPIVELRLQQREIHGITVKKLYASRKSTFWPAIDVSQSSWFEDLIYVLIQRRGYTVSDFYRDFCLETDDISAKYSVTGVRDTDGIFHAGTNLLKLLTHKARDNKHLVEAYIVRQRELFKRYYKYAIGEDLSHCSVVDLGNGGTISHSVERILDTRSAANLLFYSSERIYRYSEYSYYTSFISAATDTRNMRQLLSRSPECIEPFLVGTCGSVTGYRDDHSGTPVQADHVAANNELVSDFLEGVMRFFHTHHTNGQSEIAVDSVLPVLYRYLQLPSAFEARLFTQLQHQDNFGSNDAYPIITDAQCSEVTQWPLPTFYQEFCQHPKVKVGKIHWPQAVMTLIDDKFLARQYGLLSMDTDHDVLNLVDRILSLGWQRFSVYGAGLFFEKLLPHLQRHNLCVEQLIDRKAEISGPYVVAGYTVKSLQQALDEGCQKVLISSFAFKEEIARNIYEQTVDKQSAALEILSL